MSTSKARGMWTRRIEAQRPRIFPWCHVRCLRTRVEQRWNLDVLPARRLDQHLERPARRQHGHQVWATTSHARPEVMAHASAIAVRHAHQDSDMGHQACICPAVASFSPSLRTGKTRGGPRTPDDEQAQQHPRRPLVNLGQRPCLCPPKAVLFSPHIHREREMQPCARAPFFTHHEG
jgi:hypothetical protein